MLRYLKWRSYKQKQWRKRCKRRVQVSDQAGCLRYKTVLLIVEIARLSLRETYAHSPRQLKCWLKVMLIWKLVGMYSRQPKISLKNFSTWEWKSSLSSMKDCSSMERDTEQQSMSRRNKSKTCWHKSTSTKANTMTLALEICTRRSLT